MVSSSGEVAARGDLSKAAEQAREALRIAVATGTPEPVVRWDELGAYRLIGALVRGRDPAGLLPPSLTRLLQSSHAEVMVTTLERYLDHGGDARAAAAELSIHRSSLYDRLHKIEDTAGVDLRSGEDRLELHLGLRLWRLAGDWASSRGERPYPKRSS